MVRYLRLGSLVVIALILSIFFLWPHDKKEDTRQVDYSAFVGSLQDGKYKKVTIQPYKLKVIGEIKGKDHIADIPGQAGIERIEKTAKTEKVKLKSDNFAGSPADRSLLSKIVDRLPLLVFLLLGYIIWRSLSMQFGWNKLTVAPAKSTVKFDEVAGINEVKGELLDIVEYLKDQKHFSAAGAKVPRGVLLWGSPGVGKTMIAKAMANAAGVPFFAVTGSDFVEMYAGSGAGRVRNLFKTVEQSAPAIIFIDEIDALGRKRGGGNDGGSRESDQTLNALLTSLDGFAERDEPIIVIGATNQPSLLDSALLRPGRFDRQVHVPLPDREGRLAILKGHARDKSFADDVELSSLARRTPGMSGAELANILNEAALRAARHQRRKIEKADVEEAIFKIIAGPVREGRWGEEIRERIAYHEAGHAIVGELGGDGGIDKISLIPRGQSGGQTLSTSEEEHGLYTREKLMQKLAMLVAGRAAEEIVFAEVSSGAENDLERANEMAQSMVIRLGMGKSTGLRVYSNKTDIPSEASEDIDAILNTAYEIASKLLNENREILTKLAQLLLKEETVEREEFIKLLNS